MELIGTGRAGRPVSKKNLRHLIWSLYGRVEMHDENKWVNFQITRWTFRLGFDWG